MNVTGKFHGNLAINLPDMSVTADEQMDQLTDGRTDIST